MSARQPDLLDRLRSYLEQNQFANQTRLPPERMLAETFGVTRNRIRGSLQKLATEGVIWRHVGRGTFIGKRPPEQVNGSGTSMVSTSPREVIDARMIYEPMLARMAAFNATDADYKELQLCLDKMTGSPPWPVWASWDGRLHRAIAKASGNKLLLTMFDTLQMYRNREVFRALDKPFHGTDMAGRDHKAVVDAIRARDPKRAEASMRRHILSLRQAVFGD